MSTAHNLGLARQAFDYVKKTLPRGAGNKPSSTRPQKQCIRRVRTEYNRTKSAFCYVSQANMDECKSSGIPWPVVFGNVAKVAMQRENRCGNCAEQSAVGFLWLNERMVRPLDLMALREADVQFHQFLVIGRANDSSVKDISTWGTEAVVCDPWDEKYYPASEIPVKMFGRENMSLKSMWRIDGWAPAGICPIDG